ncbi:hypothetical protein llap_2998 [Limosa lapponica baueri]|uniref:Uncharacterized protein n=1 Tax=Limosa lapponica baueri TaxID=1758121 RepID=A0A2I0UKV6_LIMLA|nr:hypothetical protein llap_2998 [Limosa lapponica baueri]
MITEEDVGLGSKLEVGKLGQALRKDRRELLASRAAGMEGRFNGEVWSIWKKAAKKLLRQASKEQFKLNFLGQISVSEFLEEDMAKVVQLLSKMTLEKEYVRKHVGLKAEKK